MKSIAPTNHVIQDRGGTAVEKCEQHEFSQEGYKRGEREAERDKRKANRSVHNIRKSLT